MELKGWQPLTTLASQTALTPSLSQLREFYTVLYNWLNYTTKSPTYRDL